MDKFFDKYRQKAEADRELPFHQRDWLALEAKLNQSTKVKPRLPIAFWSLLGAALITVAYLFFRLLSIDQPNTSLAVNDSVQMKLIHDTIYIDKIIEKPIYITRVIKTSIPSYNKIALSSTPAVPTSDETVRAKLKNEIEILRNEIEKLNKDVAVKDDIIPVETVNVKDAKQENQKLDRTGNLNESSAPESMNVPITVSLPLAKDTLSPWQRFTRGFEPVGFVLNVTSGMPFAVQPLINNKPGWYNGIALNFLLKSGLEFQAGISKSKYAYTSAQMNSRIGIPVKQSPSNDFIFNKAEVKNYSTDIDLALLYRMKYIGSLRPALGIGLTYVLPQTTNVAYDFIIPGTKTELSDEFVVNQEIHKPFSFTLHGALHYAISPRWNVSASGIWQPLVSTRNTPAYSKIRIGIGFGYRLY